MISRRYARGPECASRRMCAACTLATTLNSTFASQFLSSIALGVVDRADSSSRRHHLLERYARVQGICRLGTCHQRPRSRRSVASTSEERRAGPVRDPENSSPLRRWRRPVSESLSLLFTFCFYLSIDAGQSAPTPFALRSTSRGSPF